MNRRSASLRPERSISSLRKRTYKKRRFGLSRVIHQLMKSNFYLNLPDFRFETQFSHTHRRRIVIPVLGTYSVLQKPILLKNTAYGIQFLYARKRRQRFEISPADRSRLAYLRLTARVFYYRGFQDYDLPLLPNQNDVCVFMRVLWNLIVKAIIVRLAWV